MNKSTPINLTLLLLISCLALPMASFAWGQTGHRVVGQIAMNHLSPKAKKALFGIMGHETLVEASTWMDNIKSDSTFDYARSWHYVTIPDGSTYSSSEKNEKGDAYEAIARMKKIIQDENSSKEEKVNALRMLTHLIGDIHQPLHVGNGEDRGGNSVKIKWFYEQSNLHRIWDSGIIDSKQLSYSEIVKMIDHPHEKENSDLDNTNVDIWVKEAMALRPMIYNFDKEAKFLSYDYMYANWPVVKDQLEKAGRRLAAVLNEILV